MLNWSLSLKAHRWIDDDVVDRDDAVPQKLFFSVGEGGRYTPESLISAIVQLERDRSGPRPCCTSMLTTQLIFYRLPVIRFACPQLATILLASFVNGRRWPRILVLLAKRVADDRHGISGDIYRW